MFNHFILLKVMFFALTRKPKIGAGGFVTLSATFRSGKPRVFRVFFFLVFLLYFFFYLFRGFFFFLTRVFTFFL